MVAFLWIFGLVILIFMLYGIGYISQGYKLPCDFNFNSDQNSVHFSECMNSTLSFGNILSMGFLNLIVFVILPIFVLIIIGLLIYYWINSNMTRAHKRAVKELSK
jgi:hypothetical protein